MRRRLILLLLAISLLVSCFPAVALSAVFSDVVNIASLPAVVSGNTQSASNIYHDEYGSDYKANVYRVSFEAGRTYAISVNDVAYLALTNVSGELIKSCYMDMNTSTASIIFTPSMDDFYYVLVCYQHHWAHQIYSLRVGVANCTVTFRPVGGKAVKAREVESGKAIGTLPKTSRSGYTFMGWYTKKSGGKKITSSYKITKNTTLYAQWKSNNAKLKTLTAKSSGKTNTKKGSAIKNTIPITLREGSITFTATPAVAGAKVQIKVGSAKYKTTKKVTVKVDKGKKKTVYIKVTAPDKKTTKTYKLIVTRK